MADDDPQVLRERLQNVHYIFGTGYIAVYSTALIATILWSIYEYYHHKQKATMASSKDERERGMLAKNALTQCDVAVYKFPFA